MSAFLAHVAREASAVPTELHEVGTWTSAGTGEVRAVWGLYRRLAEVTDIGEMVAADGVACTFNVATGSIDGLSRNDVFSVRDVGYRVVGIEPNGRGRTTLVLGL